MGRQKARCVRPHRVLGIKSTNLASRWDPFLATVSLTLIIKYSQTPRHSPAHVQSGQPLHHSSSFSLCLDRGGSRGTGNGISGTYYQRRMRLFEGISLFIPRSSQSLLVPSVLLQCLVGSLVFRSQHFGLPYISLTLVDLRIIQREFFTGALLTAKRWYRTLNSVPRHTRPQYFIPIALMLWGSWRGLCPRNQRKIQNLERLWEDLQCMWSDAKVEICGWPIRERCAV